MAKSQRFYIDAYPPGFSINAALNNSAANALLQVSEETA